MRIIELARQYGFDENQLKEVAENSGLRYRKSVITGATIDDDDVDELINKYKENLRLEEMKAQMAKQKAAEEPIKRKKIAEMLISSGFSFEGYKIVKYSGYISGDDVVQVSRGEDGIFSGATDVGEALSQALRKIRRQALAELKEAAYELGCNAVIGVDFDYITLDPETANALGGTTYLPYVFCVTANGNAVVIEKDE
jgi:uncharacterized protein YbjQ (UPF0145 family)